MICPNFGHPNEGAISFTRFVYFQIQNDFILSFLTEFMTASKRKGGKTRILVFLPGSCLLTLTTLPPTKDLLRYGRNTLPDLIF